MSSRKTAQGQRPCANIKDEQLHVDLFVKIFREILAENPDNDTPELERFAIETFRKAAELEIEWGRSVIGNKIDGISMDELEQYVKFYANVRCNQLGYGHSAFPDIPHKNPMKWIVAYQEVDQGKSDFFEQKSRQYVKVNVVDNGFDDL